MVVSKAFPILSTAMHVVDDEQDTAVRSVVASMLRVVHDVPLFVEKSAFPALSTAAHEVPEHDTELIEFVPSILVKELQIDPVFVDV